MISQDNRNQLEQLGFKRTNFGHFGPNSHEVFENEDITFVVCMEKGVYESYTYLKGLKQSNESTLDVAHKAAEAANCRLEGLDTYSRSALEPNRCATILVKNYYIIKDYLCKKDAK